MRCAGREHDRYGRLVATCTAGGIDLGGRLVAAGLAWAYVRYSEGYVADEADARQRGLGLWRGPAEPPWEFRAAGGAPDCLPPPAGRASSATGCGGAAQQRRARNPDVRQRPPEAGSAGGAPRRGIMGPRPMPPGEGAAGCLVKGNIAAGGDRIYHLPGEPSYARTRIDPRRGEAWFCDEAAARAAGFRPRRARTLKPPPAPRPPPPHPPSPLRIVPLPPPPFARRPVAPAAATVVAAVDSPPPAADPRLQPEVRRPCPSSRSPASPPSPTSWSPPASSPPPEPRSTALKALADIATGAKSLDAALGTSGLAAVANEMAHTAEDHARHFTHPGPARDDAIALFWQVAPQRLRRLRHLRRRPPRPGADRRPHGRRHQGRPPRPRLHRRALPEAFFRAVAQATLQVMLSRADTVAALAPALWRELLKTSAAIKDETAEILALVRELHAVKQTTVPEITLIAMARKISPRVTDRAEALRALEAAVDHAAEAQARGEAGSNVDDFVDATLRRLAAITAEGRLDEAAAAADDAVDRPNGLAQLLDAAIDQHLPATTPRELRGRSSDAWHRAQDTSTPILAFSVPYCRSRTFGSSAAAKGSPTSTLRSPIARPDEPHLGSRRWPARRGAKRARHRALGARGTGERHSAVGGGGDRLPGRARRSGPASAYRSTGP